MDHDADRRRSALHALASHRPRRTGCFYDEDEDELSDEEDDGITSHVSPWIAAEIEPDGEGGLRFTSGSDTATLTLTEILRSCGEPRGGCALGE